MRRGDFRRVSMRRLLNALPLLLALIFNPAFASIDSDGDGFNDDVDIFPVMLKSGSIRMRMVSVAMLIPSIARQSSLH